MANHMYIYGGGERERKKEGKVEGGVYFRELAHMIVGTGKFKLCKSTPVFLKCR